MNKKDDLFLVYDVINLGSIFFLIVICNIIYIMRNLYSNVFRYLIYLTVSKIMLTFTYTWLNMYSTGYFEYDDNIYAMIWQESSYRPPQTDTDITKYVNLYGKIYFSWFVKN